MRVEIREDEQISTRQRHGPCLLRGEPPQSHLLTHASQKYPAHILEIRDSRFERIRSHSDVDRVTAAVEHACGMAE